MERNAASHTPYVQPSSEVHVISTQGIVCQSPYRNMENPDAPGQDHSW